MRNVRLRVSRGVGSSPKLWIVAKWRGGSAQAAECDEFPCRFDLEANGLVRDPDGEISGILWGPEDAGSNA